jgi:hypothetical protein
MKANVEQVYRYLTAYLSAGGTFPEQLNSKIRNLAAQVARTQCYSGTGVVKGGVIFLQELVQFLFNSCF